METLNNLKKVKIATSKLDITNMLPVSKISSTGNVEILSRTTNILDSITKQNTTYCICYDFNLNENTLVLPKGSTLEFRGGSISKGTIVGNDSAIIADNKVLYNIQIEGTWRCVGNVGWWAKGSSIIEYTPGVYIPQNTDDHTNILQALDSSFRELIFPPKLFYTRQTLVLRKEKKLVLQGSDMKLSLAQCKDSIHNSCVIYTDQDIDLLRIAVDENGNTHSTVTITGGSFDVSKCVNYTHDCIQIKTDNGEKMWGININTSVKGFTNSETGVGINICPNRDSKADAVENNTLAYDISDFGYATQIRINGTIADFGTGIRATNYMNSSNTRYYNWCTDVQLDCSIINCHEAVYSNTDIDIRGMIQAGHFYTGNPNNGVALINLDSTMGAVSANIYDIGSGDTTEYALKINNPNARIAAHGMFLGFYLAGLWQNGKDCVTGYKDCLKY